MYQAKFLIIFLSLSFSLPAFATLDFAAWQSWAHSGNTINGRFSNKYFIFTNNSQFFVSSGIQVGNVSDHDLGQFLLELSFHYPDLQGMSLERYSIGPETVRSLKKFEFMRELAIVGDASGFATMVFQKPEGFQNLSYLHLEFNTKRADDSCLNKIIFLIQNGKFNQLEQLNLVGFVPLNSLKILCLILLKQNMNVFLSLNKKEPKTVIETLRDCEELDRKEFTSSYLKKSNWFVRKVRGKAFVKQAAKLVRESYLAVLDAIDDRPQITIEPKTVTSESTKSENTFSYFRASDSGSDSADGFLDSLLSNAGISDSISNETYDLLRTRPRRTDSNGSYDSDENTSLIRTSSKSSNSSNEEMPPTRRSSLRRRSSTGLSVSFIEGDVSQEMSPEKNQQYIIDITSSNEPSSNQTDLNMEE